MQQENTLSGHFEDMKATPSALPVFDSQKTISQIKKYLPAQAPLKDFIFQNQLQSFQELPFFNALGQASEIFGYKVFLSVAEFRDLYKKNKIRKDILDKVLNDRKGPQLAKLWKTKLLSGKYEYTNNTRVGRLRANWKDKYQLDLDSVVHKSLFRIVCSYLDQGISIWNFPLWKSGFLNSVREMEKNSFTSFFKTERARKLLLENKSQLESLLSIVAGDEKYFEQYLFDQQFAHQGWSGMVSVIEDRPETLMDKKKISLEEFIILELLLEIDALTFRFKENWRPCANEEKDVPLNLFADATPSELHEVQCLWQEAYEWSYYDEVLAGLQCHGLKYSKEGKKTFQAMFCIDERETSLRDYIERTDPNAETFATPGFFNVEFYFQPEHGKAYTKLCPAPITPRHLIKESTPTWKKENDYYLSKKTHSLFAGMIISPALGFYSAVQLAVSIFKPSMGPATASSFKHMDKISNLTIEHAGQETENGLQVGFTTEEMSQRVEGLLRSVGLLKNFAPLIYMIGHGASSVNNPFYAMMDCGACSCRPGSVNARAFSYMANHPEVRKTLAAKGIHVPAETQFLGGLHDTTRDEILYYDESELSVLNLKKHQKNQAVLNSALDLNAKERSRRFESIDTTLPVAEIHEQVLTRSVSLFEPRPELDHANNALTIIGRRDLTRKLFLDRRAFMNSYDYQTDPEGAFLFNILKPIAPVCGGINLSYYFSRVDNHKLGAGTKLPHNVMGLFGVSNGIEGDLRPGLPIQMIESHDPVRQLLIVEHYPDVFMKVFKALPTYGFFYNNWMHVAVIHPETKAFYLFKEGELFPYNPLKTGINTVSDMEQILESSQSTENLPVYIVA